MHNALETIRPIGVFDSGVGGLSVLQALRTHLPHESFIYVADCRYAPYGDKSLSFIEWRSQQIAGFLCKHQAKALVLACNTASVMTAHSLRSTYSLPVVAMEPAIKPATLTTKSGVVLVLATANTIKSESVARLCKSYGANNRIILQACPGLVEQVERQQFNHPTTRQLLQKYIFPAITQGADVIVLGCTHYAFLSREIAALVGPEVMIAEPSHAIARRLSQVAPASPLAGTLTDTVFFTSGAPEELSSFLRFIGEPSERVHALPTSDHALAFS